LNGQHKVSLDLGLSIAHVGVEGSSYLLPGGLSISRGDLELVASRDNAVFFVSGKGIFQVAVSGGHYWKLVPTLGAPTLEIDGIRMHRTKGTTPDVDARVKVDAMGLDRGRVLDTCGGLGYTASEAVQRGANLVFSVERSPEVLQLARLNPWSRGLFYGGRQHLVLGDSYALCVVFPSGFFDYIVHDPPRLSRAGKLYGSVFYRQLFRLLRPRGRLFHYTGEPGSRYRGRDVPRGVLERLRATGFVDLKYVEEALGVVAMKRDG
jgi:predicted methyltransferase